MGKFLDIFDHLKLNQQDINHLTRSITHNGIKAAIKSLPKKKSSGPDGLNSFCEDCIILIPKPNKDTTTTTKRELQVNLFNEHGCKNNKILANQIRHCFKKDHIT
jgi:hypothetical protein